MHGGLCPLLLFNLPIESRGSCQSYVRFSRIRTRSGSPFTSSFFTFCGNRWTVPRKGSNPLAGYPPLIVVVDALDECSEADTIEFFLRALVHRAETVLGGYTSIRFILVSRPEPHIMNVINQSSAHCFVMELHRDVPRSVVMNDIRIHVEAGLQEMCTRRAWDTEWYTRDDIDFIVSGSEVLFIYASTALKYLQGALGNPKKRLQLIRDARNSDRSTMARPLEILYATILINLGRPDSLESFEVNDLRRILFILTFLLSPLRIADIANILELEIDEVRECLISLSSIALIPSRNDEHFQPVQILHVSFTDFLLSTSQHLPRHWKLDIKYHHRQLMGRCIRILVAELKEHILGHKINRRTHIDDVPIHLISSSIPPTLLYAARHWITHMRMSFPSPDDLLSSWEDDPTLPVFVNNFILRWLECLAWTKSLASVTRELQHPETLKILQVLVLSLLPG